MIAESPEGPAGRQAGDGGSPREDAASDTSGKETPVSGPRQDGPAQDAPSSGGKAGSADHRGHSSKDHRVHDQADYDIHVYLANFLGSIDKVVLGAGLGLREPSKQRSGKVDAVHVTEELTWYVQPPCFAKAISEALDVRTVIIAGTRGSGRRCGAMAVLRTLVDGDVVVLPPKLSVVELGEYPFESHLGYLLEDVAEGHGGDEEAIGWLSLRQKLAAADSYLVIVVDASRRERRTRGRPPQIGWLKPHPDALVRRYLDDVPEAQLALEVIDEFGDRLSMADLHAFLSDVAQGTEVRQATRIFDTSTRDGVTDWFDSTSDPARIADVTAAAFFPGIEERDFELVQCALLECIAPAVLSAGTTGTSEPSTRSLLAERKNRWAGNSLLRLRSGEMPSTARHVEFEIDEQRGHVLEELDRRYDRRFWIAVAGWLSETVELVRDGSDDAILVQVGLTLALLGRTAQSEVHDSYVSRWSNQGVGSRHQRVIVYMMLWMPYIEGLDAYALDTARGWSRRGSESQRWTAATAFGGALGLAYPMEAINQLWSLIERYPENSKIPAIALAKLFAALVEAESPYANRLLVGLDNKLRALTRTGSRHRLILHAALRATVRVLAEKPSRKCLPRSVELLQRSSVKAQNRIGQLWATTLLSLVVRSAAGHALVDTLHLLSENNPDDIITADILGQVIHQALRPEQIGPIHETLIAIATNQRNTGPSVVSILQRWVDP